MQDIMWVACAIYNAAFIHYKMGDEWATQHPLRAAYCVVAAPFGTVAIVFVILLAYVARGKYLEETNEAL